MGGVLRGIGALGLMIMASLPGSHQWSRRLGVPSPTLAVQIRSVAGHGSGCALVAGSFRGELSLDRSLDARSADPDLFVTLIDRHGEPAQSILVGGAGPRRLASASFDGGGDIILAGTFTGTLTIDGLLRSTAPGGGADGFVARLDHGGHALWLKQIAVAPGARIDIHGAGAAAAGDIIVGGYLDGSGDDARVDGKSLSVSNKFAVALDPAGHVSWSVRLRYGVADTLPPVVDPAGNAIFAFVSENLEWIHLVKLDPSGSPVWRRKLGGGITHELTGLAVDGAGALLLTGRGGLDDAPPDGELGFVARIDPTGSVVAVRRGRGLAYASVAVDEHDGVVIAGSALPSSSFGDAFVFGAGPGFVAGLDLALRPRWVAGIEGAVDPALHVGTLPGQAALVAGSYGDTIRIGGHRIPGGAGKNAFAAALTP